MIKSFRLKQLQIFLLFTTFILVSINTIAAVVIQNLQVEYANTPLGIDVKTPRFSWQMAASGAERDISQSAFQLVVTDSEGILMWDTRKLAKNKSLNIEYTGLPLKPATRYNWKVTVWDQDDKPSAGSSWFETGLMNPDPKLSAWSGATWIGGGDNDLVFYSQYLSVFKLEYTIQLDNESGTTKAAFVFGANDPRLMDKYKNIFGVESKKDGSYIKFELNISKVDGSESGLAQLNVYRIGYHPDDKANIPFKTFNIPKALINNANKYQPHKIYCESVFGSANLFIDGIDDGHKIVDPDNQNNTPGLFLNPVGRGGDFISFPMVANIGFSVDPGQKASFSDVEIRNFRSPSNKLFGEDLNNREKYNGVFSQFTKNNESGLKIQDHTYSIDGGKNGLIILADPGKNSMPLLRTTFNTEVKKIVKARLYVTARGIYEIYINGKRVGNDYFNPGLTQYNKTHLYQTYDVSDLIKIGKNAMGAMLGEGWWSGNITYSGQNWNFFGDRQSLLAKLVITYSDGSTKIVTTNPDTWTYFNDGPLVYGSFFQGEVYDATRESAVLGWNTVSYNDHLWKKATAVPLNGNAFIDKNISGTNGMAPIMNYDNMSLFGQFGENASIVKELKAVGMEEVRPGVFVYDMGQNMVGVPQITIQNGITGKKLTLRYAEVKYPDLAEYGKKVGMIMLENIRGALAQDTYILKGGNEVIQPRFTFHGYRFIEITGIEKPLPIASVKGEVISSLKTLASSYETSNPKVNKLWENITWSTRGNFLSIPTDCPQRNERMGWNGDISLFSRTSTYITNTPQFLRRHMIAMADAQREDGRFSDVAPLGGGFGGILWGSAGITVAWESFQQYGDEVMIAEHYDAMKKYMTYLSTRIDPKTGIMDEGPLGDWLSPEGGKNDNTLLWEAYYIYDLEMMSKIAIVLGKAADAADFRTRKAEHKVFFNKTYVNAETGQTVKSTSGQVYDNQASYAVPLALGAFDSVNEKRAAKHLAAAVTRQNTDDSGAILPEYSLMTGFIGTAWISKALSDHGYNDITYHVLQQKTYPSWLYSVEQGATTIWERLNSYTVDKGFGGNNSMNSFSHYSFGAVGAWMYNYSLGIQRDENEPGFKHFVLQPTPDPTGQMTFARGHYDSMYGRIESGWKTNNGNVTYSVTVPANTSATLYIRALDPKKITEGGKNTSQMAGVKFIKYESGNAVFDLKSGHYEFRSELLNK
ncbi:MAG: family 78 glycoside hydrolase catalytic domain [Mariniphaga sp.]